MQRLDELCISIIRFLTVDAVEEAQAASPFGWERWTLDVDILGVDRFGASGPGPEVLAEYGFTVDNVVARTVAVLKAQTARTSART